MVDRDTALAVTVHPAVFVEEPIAVGPLHAAAQRADVAALSQLLATSTCSALLQAVDESGWTALHHAAGSTCAEIVSLLLEHRADVHARTETAATALHISAFNGRMGATRLLVLHGADVLAVDEDGRTPLFDACYRSSGQCPCVADTRDQQPGRVAAFLQRLQRASPSERASLAKWAWELYVSAALDEALVDGCDAKLSHLLAIHRRCVDARDYDGWSALHSASQLGQLAQVKRILMARANVGAVTHCGESALHLAAREGHLHVVRLLVAAGAKVCATTRSGATPLQVAARRGTVASDEVAAFLSTAARGPSPPPLHLARAALASQGPIPCFADFAEIPHDHPFDEPPPRLQSLPTDVLAAILSKCALSSLGVVAASCEALSRLCDSHGPWTACCEREGLIALPGDDAGRAPKELLRRAAACNHAAGKQPSSRFEWSRVELDAETGGQRATATCKDCGRCYAVALSRGFVDNAKGASMMMTRSQFRALHEAPRAQQAWVVMWDGRAAAAVRAATAACALQSSTSPGRPWGGLTSFMSEGGV